MDEPLDAHLERAKEYLAIAESTDSKRAAYMKAAEEIAAYKEETGCTNVLLASEIGCNQGTVSRLLKWHGSGYEAPTPFLMDGEATTRAARSHAKKLLSNPTEAAKLVTEIAAALDTPEVIEALNENDEATDHIFHATTKLAGSRKPSKKAKKNRSMEEMTIVLSLIAVLGQLRELAKEDSDSPLVKECKNLMRETLEILDGIEEADDPEAVEKMLDDLGDFLAAH